MGCAVVLPATSFVCQNAHGIWRELGQLLYEMSKDLSLKITGWISLRPKKLMGESFVPGDGLMCPGKANFSSRGKPAPQPRLSCVRGPWTYTTLQLSKSIARSIGPEVTVCHKILLAPNPHA